jgi:Flp pilus assembly protein TadG
MKHIVFPTAAHVRRFLSADNGVVAVEFAMILPIMVTLYFGLTTITHGYATKQRIELASRTMSDLTGRLKTETINDAEVTNVALASTAIMAPYDSNGMTIALASVVVRKKGDKVEGRVCWSAARKVQSGALVTATPPPELTKDQIVLVPEGYRQDGTSYIVSVTRHTYKPVVGHAITGDIEFRDELPWPVRNVQQVIWEGQGACPITPIS